MFKLYILALSIVNLFVLMWFMKTFGLSDNIPVWYLWLLGPAFIHVANRWLFDGEDTITGFGKLTLASFPLSFFAVVAPFLTAIFTWVTLIVLWHIATAFA